MGAFSGPEKASQPKIDNDQKKKNTKKQPQLSYSLDDKESELIQHMQSNNPYTKEGNMMQQMSKASAEDHNSKMLQLMKGANSAKSEPNNKVATATSLHEHRQKKLDPRYITITTGDITNLSHQPLQELYTDTLKAYLHNPNQCIEDNLRRIEGEIETRNLIKGTNECREFFPANYKTKFLTDHVKSLSDEELQKIRTQNERAYGIYANKHLVLNYKILQKEIAARKLDSNKTQCLAPVPPNLNDYKGKDINKSGKISSDTKNYKEAISTGLNIRSKPLLPYNNLVIGKLKYGTTVFVKSTNIKGGWYYVVSMDGQAGWINQNFVATDMPGMQAKLYHIQPGEHLGNILYREYSGKYNIRSGDDCQHLATAFVIANEGRQGVSIDKAKFKESLDQNYWKNKFDPWNKVHRAIYQSVSIKAGMNLWLPDVAFIQSLKDSGQLRTRPGIVNDLLGFGKGITGFSAGVFEGFFGSIVDTLSGLWDIAKGIIGTIGKVLTGSIISDIQNIIGELRNLSVDKMKQMASALLATVVGGAKDFASNWNHPDAYRKWNFRGKVVGNILLEVVLAIFTAGTGNALKWIGKLGKYAPKLAKILTKAVNKVDAILPKRLRRNKNGKKVKSDLDDSNTNKKDKKTRQKQLALALSKTITEAHDARDSSISVLRTNLEIVKRKFKVVRGFEINPKAQPGHYEVWMLASKHNVDPDYTTKEGNEVNGMIPKPKARITKDIYRQLEKFDPGLRKAFMKATKKGFVKGDSSSEGIKKLKGGMRIGSTLYEYELKVVHTIYGKHRLYGNISVNSKTGEKFYNFSQWKKKH